MHISFIVGFDELLSRRLHENYPLTLHDHILKIFKDNVSSVT